MDLAEWSKIKSKVERMQREADRARGSVDTLLFQLQSEFGCPSLKTAKKLLTKLIEEEEKSDSVLQEALTKFEEEWSKKLEE